MNPQTAASAHPTLPHSPAAERNAPHILQALQAWLPPQAEVLEVASGTGQHAQHFTAAMPGWRWQPTEADAAPLASVAARCQAQAGVLAPRVLDVLTADAGADAGAEAGGQADGEAEFAAGLKARFDAVYAANLLHIAPWAVTPAFMRLAARALRPGGVLVVYGPFVIEGETLAPSNAAFDADLRARNPQWGLRALHEVQAAAAQAGLQLAERRPMPANNQLLRFVIGEGRLDN